MHFSVQLFQQSVEKQHRVPSACIKMLIFFQRFNCKTIGSHWKYVSPILYFLFSFLKPLLVIPFTQTQLWITCLQMERQQRVEGKEREREGVGKEKGG